jgi:tripeptide aminopeptidase
MERALERFLRYARIDTQSKDDAEAYPSTPKQFDLLNLLVQELKGLGLKDVTIDQYGYVMATIPSNLPATHPAHGTVPTIGFIAHVDTSPSTSGANVKPQVIENYKGGDITLPGDPTVVIHTAENPELTKNIGKTIVTTDGTTLLGADDKAGIAIIMTAAEHMLTNPNIMHGDVRVAFTPDEEVGAGTKFFDLKRFRAQFAYTIDGDRLGEINKETFSANLATITVHGRNIHPGTAKNVMVNSIRAMADIITRMPKEIAPETTEGYEPYIHPHVLQGEEAKSTLKILLRQYRNMRDHMGSDTRVLDCLWEAARRAGVEPKWAPIRGGTDGSRLTEKGLPTPNIFTGGNNYHGKTEWLSVYAMEKSIDTVVNLVQVWVEKTLPV